MLDGIFISNLDKIFIIFSEQHKVNRKEEKKKKDYWSTKILKERIQLFTIIYLKSKVYLVSYLMHYFHFTLACFINGRTYVTR